MRSRWFRGWRFGVLVAGGVLGILLAAMHIVAVGARVLGDARGRALVGSPLEIEGKTVDGRPFDWSQYRGKVVLVDFWASWCGPCMEELDSIRQHYDLYHPHGFEVVGVNLDRDRQQAERVLQGKGIAWTNLFEGGFRNGGPDRSMATRYGIVDIPALFLVGPDGKVVSVRVQGGQLGEELNKLLGPATAESPQRS